MEIWPKTRLTIGKIKTLSRKQSSPERYRMNTSRRKNIFSYKEKYLLDAEDWETVKKD